MWLRPWPFGVRRDAAPPGACAETAAWPLPAWQTLPLLVAAVALRLLPLFWNETPAGHDYSIYLHYAESYLATGRLPTAYPNYQLGTTEWQYLPGAPGLYAAWAWFTGAPPLAALPVTALLGGIEAAGVLLLAWRLFGRSDLAVVAALVAATRPPAVEMTGWGGHANLLGFALLPFAYLAFLDYWSRPGLRSGALLALLLSAVGAAHHLSAAWLAATLLATCLALVALAPAPSLARLAGLVPLCLLPTAPLFLTARDVAASMGGISFLSADRFAPTRHYVEASLGAASAALDIAVIVPGLAALVLLRAVPREGKLLVLAHTLLGVALSFGWVAGVHFHHWRALQFFWLPTAVAAGALLHLWSSRWLRVVVASALITSQAGLALTTAADVSRRYPILTPDVLASARWLSDHSRPGDVVLVSALLGFQLVRLVDRPLMVAVPPHEFFSAAPEPAAVARDAVALLTGDPAAERLLEARRVRFVVVRRPGWFDIPDPALSQRSLARSARLVPALETGSVVVYRVVR